MRGIIIICWALPGCIFGLLLATSGCSHEFEIRRQLHLRQSLQRLNKSLLLYTKAHHGQMPLMQNKQQIVTALKPYFQKLYPHLEIEQGFTVAGEAVQCSWNQRLSGHKIKDFPVSKLTVTFYGDREYENGFRDVAFLDGHTDPVKSTEWHRVTQYNPGLK